jgi:hypothetical protein
MPPNARRPSNAPPPVARVSVTEAEKLLQDIAAKRQAPTDPQAAYQLCVLDENGSFSLLTIATLEELRATLVGYIGREVSLRAFVGVPLPLSAASTSQPLMRYLLVPTKQPIPLFDIPADLVPDTEGFVGPTYRVLTAPIELQQPSDDDEEAASPEGDAADQTGDEEGGEFPEEDEGVI